MKKYLLTAALILALAVSSAVIAQKGGERHRPAKGEMMDQRGPGHGPGFFNEKFLIKIGVSEQVRTQIKAIMKDLKNDMIEGHKQIKEKRLALKDEMLKPELDEAKIKGIYNEIAEMHKQQQLKAEYKKLEIAKLLTLDQRKKVVEHMTQMQKEFFKKMRGHMMEE